MALPVLVTVLTFSFLKELILKFIFVILNILLLVACNTTPVEKTFSKSEQERDARHKYLLKTDSGGTVMLKTGIQHKFVNFDDRGEKIAIEVHDEAGKETVIDDVDFIVFGKYFMFVKLHNGLDFLTSRDNFQKIYGYNAVGSLIGIFGVPMLTDKGEFISPEVNKLDYIVMDGKNKANVGMDFSDELIIAKIIVKNEEAKKLKAEKKELARKKAEKNAKLREAERKKREKIAKEKQFKKDLANPANKGVFLCKKGVLSYYNPWGSVPVKAKGMIAVNLEEYNEFNNMMKVITAGWKVLPQRNINIANGTSPSLDGITGQKGITLFVASDGFQPCGQ